MSLRKLLLMGVVITGWSLLISTRAEAALIAYTNEAIWQAAVGANTLDNLNSFAVDTDFKAAAVAIMNGTVSGTTGVNGALTQKIDANPLEFSGFYSIDGTSLILGDVTGAAQFLRFNFTAPVTAWGVQTSGLADVPRTTTIQVFDAGNVLLGTVFPTSADNTVRSFYGFQLTTGAADHIIFSNSNAANDVFGLDNIRFTTHPQAVPEPASFFLLGSGVVIALAAHRRRKAR